MALLDPFFDQIDANRLSRVRELSSIKFRFGTGGDELSSKALVVLTYAHWEGFYNDCVRTYVSFLREAGHTISDIAWTLLVGALSANLNRLRDRNHSPDARLEFVRRLELSIACDFSEFDDSIIQARSNLDFDRLRQNFEVLSFDLAPYQKYRLRIDKELVAWRHQVAHGDSPDLSKMDSHGHVELVTDLQLMIADQFQYAMLKTL